MLFAQSTQLTHFFAQFYCTIYQRQFLEVLVNEIIPAKKLSWILVLVTHCNISKYRLAHICCPLGYCEKYTVFKIPSHCLQFKLKRPSHWVEPSHLSSLSLSYLALSQSLKSGVCQRFFCWRHSISLVFPRKVSVLEFL